MPSVELLFNYIYTSIYFKNSSTYEFKNNLKLIKLTLGYTRQYSSIFLAWSCIALISGTEGINQGDYQPTDWNKSANKHIKSYIHKTEQRGQNLSLLSL